MKDLTQLGRRSRQIVEVVYARGEATANDVVAAIPDPPSRTAVRTFLRILEERGYLTHRQEGKEYIYKPTQDRRHVGKSALRQVLAAFFGNSMEQAMAAHLSDPKVKLSAKDIERLQNLIEKAKRGEGRQ